MQYLYAYIDHATHPTHKASCICISMYQASCYAQSRICICMYRIHVVLVCFQEHQKNMYSFRHWRHLTHLISFRDAAPQQWHTIEIKKRNRKHNIANALASTSRLNKKGKGHRCIKRRYSHNKTQGQHEMHLPMKDKDTDDGHRHSITMTTVRK